MFLGFPCGSAGKESTCNAGDLGVISGLGRSPGEGKGYPFKYSGLENSMDCIVHVVTKSQTRLSNFHFHCLSFLSVTALAYDLILAELEGRQHSVLQALSLSPVFNRIQNHHFSDFSLEGLGKGSHRIPGF